ncbi:MAG TPA: TetR/AcrR family transcriptional regulator [Bacteroidota bacterium]|nr:TetR/AcrR family transcriptional regulator [Bacteroidota bacterium]
MSDLSKDDIVKAEILKAAEHVFQRWGSVKTTMEDIAREAGKGKSTLYYYFQSKEEIFDAVVIGEFKKIIERAMETADQNGTAKERLIRYIVESITQMRNKVGTYTILKDEIRRDQRIIKRLRDLYEEREEHYIEGVLRFGLQRKEFTFLHESEVITAAETITGMIHALEIYLLVENDDIAQIDIAARFIAYGL